MQGPGQAKALGPGQAKALGAGKLWRLGRGQLGAHVARQAAAQAEPARARALAELDRSFLRLRSVLLRSPASSVPVASVGRVVDQAKVLACETLAELELAGGTVAVKDLAAAACVDHSTMSRLLGDAEGEGLVERRRDPADGRRTTVRLTAVGRQVITDAAAVRLDFLAHLLGEWPGDDLDAFAGYLVRLADSLLERLGTWPAGAPIPHLPALPAAPGGDDARPGPAAAPGPGPVGAGAPAGGPATG